MNQYDYLIVGAGLFGIVCAYELNKRGYRCLVIDRRNHIGGNCYTEKVNGINIHKYGAHIFKTSDKYIWDYMQRFAEFNNFINTPMAIYKDEIYNLPFNMNTFSRLWGVKTPSEAKRIIENQSSEVESVINLEDYAISQVGKDIYQKLIKGYTEKQWGKSCRDLPISIMRRIPIRYTYNNNYYMEKYQGVPVGGYTSLFEKMLSGIEVQLNTSYENVNNKVKYLKGCIYCGSIDEFYSYKYGPLEYRSLRFETEYLDVDNYQGVAVVNYTDSYPAYTRIIEHKHFEGVNTSGTVISKEYPIPWEKGLEPFYPINDDNNTRKYDMYAKLSQKEDKVYFGGRLGMYRYPDMQDTVKLALELIEKMESENDEKH